MEEIKSCENVVAVFERYRVGETIKATKNVNQRFCEIDIVCNSNEEMKRTVDWIYQTLGVLDENSEEMIVSKYDTKILSKR